jgi:hypothetical protein
VLLRIQLARGSGLDAERLARQIVKRVDGAALVHEQGLVGVEVRSGEGDLFPALGCDRHRSRGDVALARVEILAGLDALKRRVDDRLADAELLCDQVDDVDVEADDPAALLKLKRPVGQVRAGGQAAGIDKLDAAVGSASRLLISTAGGDEDAGQQRQRDPLNPAMIARLKHLAPPCSLGSKQPVHYVLPG